MYITWKQKTKKNPCIWNRLNCIFSNTKYSFEKGSLTSNDSGHGSYIPSGSGSGAVSDFHSDNFNGSSNNGGGGLYQVACSIVHNSPSPITNDRFHPQQQRRHSHAYPGMFLYTPDWLSPPPGDWFNQNNNKNKATKKNPLLLSLYLLFYLSITHITRCIILFFFSYTHNKKKMTHYNAKKVYYSGKIWKSSITLENTCYF